MYEPEPRMLFTPSGSPYLFQFDTINAPASGETAGPTREFTLVPSHVGTDARIYANVVSGPTGARAEVQLDASGWVAGDTGIALGTPGVEQEGAVRVYAPELDAEEEESPTIVVSVHVVHRGEADWDV
jgi:hypothetical protein